MDKENVQLPDDKMKEVNGGIRTPEQTLQYFCPTCKYVFEEKKTAIGRAQIVPSEQFCPNCKEYVFPSHKIF